jgi:hypothetical protein
MQKITNEKPHPVFLPRVASILLSSCIGGYCISAKQHQAIRAVCNQEGGHGKLPAGVCNIKSIPRYSGDGTEDTDTCSTGLLKR